MSDFLQRSWRHQPHARFATLTRSIKGKLTTWRKGQKVIAIRLTGSSYAIERIKWHPQKLPITNQCCGIPRSALKFL